MKANIGGFFSEAVKMSRRGPDGDENGRIKLIPDRLNVTVTTTTSSRAASRALDSIRCGRSTSYICRRLGLKRIYLKIHPQRDSRLTVFIV